MAGEWFQRRESANRDVRLTSSLVDSVIWPTVLLRIDRRWVLCVDLRDHRKTVGVVGELELESFGLL